jgi:hypothetical protein
VDSRGRERMRTRPLWLIAKQRNNELEVFTIGTDVLPVFSFREEAEMFLGRVAEGWRVRQTTCGELVSVLYGPCKEATHVSLDPVPGITELVSLSRRAFVKALLEGEPKAPAA